MVFGLPFGAKQEAKVVDDSLTPAEKLGMMRKLSKRLVPPSNVPGLTTVTFGKADDSDGIMLNGYCEVKGGLEGCRWEPVSRDDEEELLRAVRKAAGKNPERLAEVEKTRDSMTKNRPHGSVNF